MQPFSLSLLWNTRRTIATIVGSFIVLAVLVSGVTPIRYASTAELLVVQRGIFSRDPSVASRSTEYLSQVLAEAINSRSFLNAVRATDPNVLIDLPTEPNQEKVQWNKRVQPYVVRDTGILKISTYDRDHDRATALAEAVVSTLLAHENEYHGEGDAVSIRVLESPLTTRWPASPNIFRNLLVAVVAGLLAGLGYVYLWPEADVTQSVLARRSLGGVGSRSSHGHKHLMDWHVPGETAEAALERMHPEPNSGRPSTGSGHNAYSLSEVEGQGREVPETHDAHDRPSDLPTVFEHMAGRTQ